MRTMGLVNSKVRVISTRVVAGPTKFLFLAPSPTPEDFQSFLTKRLEENPSPDQAAVRALTARAEQAQREKPTPSEPAPAAAPTSAEEEEASGGDSGGGAYNPETGEINWDCACLGGMAHGPCGPEFREAFSCFIYSEDEPKGINCVEKFQGMQTCFREHPETYASGMSFSSTRFSHSLKG